VNGKCSVLERDRGKFRDKSTGPRFRLAERDGYAQQVRKDRPAGNVAKPYEDPASARRVFGVPSLSIAPQHVAISGQNDVMRILVSGCGVWWAWQNSNLRPLPCQGRSALFAALSDGLSRSFLEREAWPEFGQVNAKWPQVATPGAREGLA
jgi:hypothetical protein